MYEFVLNSIRLWNHVVYILKMCLNMRLNMLKYTFLGIVRLILIDFNTWLAKLETWYTNHNVRKRNVDDKVIFFHIMVTSWLYFGVTGSK